MAAIGTQFDVRLEEDSTVVTVIRGGSLPPSPTLGKSGTKANDAPRYVDVGANQQIRVTEAEWPATPTSVDAPHTTSWL